MKNIDVSLAKINRYLNNNTFDITISPIHDNNFLVKTNFKVKLIGLKEYFRIGVPIEHVEYTLYILPSNSESDFWYKTMAEINGYDLKIDTTSKEYFVLRMQTDEIVSNLLKYFGVEKPAICTRVITELKSNKMNENLIIENKYDNVVRQIVRDIISIYKKGRDGEFGLPEDLYPEKHFYEFEQLETELQIFVEIITDDTVDGFDVDADFFRDDEMIYVTITTNPRYTQDTIQPLIGELNEIIRHEIEHVKQYEQGFKFPKKEPKDPEKYYTQSHELEAQRAGFRRRSKKEKFDYESLVRKWFEDNQHKHNLSPEKAERVIQKIIKEK